MQQTPYRTDPSPVWLEAQSNTLATVNSPMLNNCTLLYKKLDLFFLTVTRILLSFGEKAKWIRSQNRKATIRKASVKSSQFFLLQIEKNLGIQNQRGRGCTYLLTDGPRCSRGNHGDRDNSVACSKSSCRTWADSLWRMLAMSFLRAGPTGKTTTATAKPWPTVAAREYR